MACIAVALTALFGIDMVLKLMAVSRFFARPAPPESDHWPSVTLISPITRGVSRLADNLKARLELEYPAEVQHLLICDADDTQIMAVCQEIMEAHPLVAACVVPVTAPPGRDIAPKITKLQAGIARAEGEVLAFVDDDVALRKNALRMQVTYLGQPGVGAVFGLPCFTNWRTLWSSLITGLVNANMPPSFIALTYLTEPFRITGHFTAIQRTDLHAAGGLEGLDGFLDDDYVLARRLRAVGYRLVQTPVVYDIDNEIPSVAAYAAQLKRWFVLPRQAMMSTLSLREKLAVTAVSAFGFLMPPIIGVLALVCHDLLTLGCLSITLVIFYAAYGLITTQRLQSRTPQRRWPLLAVVALLVPIHAMLTLLSGNVVTWRGTKIRVAPDGTYEVMP
jgi:ceramide glucosyltransferase